MKEQINSIPLEQILSTLWIRYKKNWRVGFLYHENKLTDWYRADFIRGIVSDFSWKWRPSWDRIKFVSETLWLDFPNTLQWFVDRFNIKREEIMQTEKDIKWIWDSLWPITDEQIEYLRDREIVVSKDTPRIKNYNWNLCIPILSTWWHYISLQSRSITKKAFYIEKETKWDWLFFNSLDETKKAIVVVEWFADYLSLRQYTTNVVWLVNANNEDQIRMLKELSGKYLIYLVPDNDEAWEKCLKMIEEAWIKAYIFSLRDYWVKDINELLTSFKIGEEVMITIFAEAKKPMTNIWLAIEKAKVYKKLYEQNWWRLGVSSGYPLIDQYTWWFIRWKTYLVMAFSNVWKTRFAYSLCRELIKTKKKIHFYSLEIDTWMLIIELLSALMQKDRDYIIKNINEIDTSYLEQYIEIYDNIRSIEAIEWKIKADAPDIAIIDFVQIIEAKGSEYEKISDIALRMQKLGIITWTTLINLSQVNNESRFVGGENMMPKGSWALFASSDVILSLWAKEWERYLTIAKNKFWKAGTTFLLNVDYASATFNMAEDFEGNSNSTKTSFKKI